MYMQIVAMPLWGTSSEWIEINFPGMLMQSEQKIFLIVWTITIFCMFTPCVKKEGFSSLNTSNSGALVRA